MKNNLAKYIESTWETLKSEGVSTMMKVEESKAPIYLRANDQTVAFLLTIDAQREIDIKSQQYSNVNISIEKLDILGNNLSEIAITPEEVTLAPGENLTLKINGFGGLNVKTVQVENKEFTFESDNDTYATVDETGLVHAVADGVSNVTVKYKKDESIKDTITVNVVTA